MAAHQRPQRSPLHIEIASHKVRTIHRTLVIYASENSPFSRYQMYSTFRVKLSNDAKPEPVKYAYPLPSPLQFAILPPRDVWRPDPVETYAHSDCFPRCANLPGSARRQRIAVLKDQARRITTPPGSRGSQIQTCLLQMVFDEVTPYPDDIWTCFLAVAAKR